MNFLFLSLNQSVKIWLLFDSTFDANDVNDEFIQFFPIKLFTQFFKHCKVIDIARSK